MRIIDADKLKRKVQRIATKAWMMKLNASVETTLNQFIDYIDEAPTIDIESKRGEWKHLKGDEWLCSNCGYVVWTEGSWEHPLKRGKDYCEHCGARMKTEDNERDYERAIEQMQHNMLYEPTYNPEDGSM